MNFIQRNFKTLFLPIFVILSVFGICIFYLLDNIPRDNSVLNVKFTNEKIVVSNELLMTDAVGKVIEADNIKCGTTGFTEFEVSSNIDEKVKFEIYLTKEDALYEVPMKYVKVYLTDENNNPLLEMENRAIPTYYDLKVADSNLSGKLLYSGSLKNKESK